MGDPRLRQVDNRGVPLPFDKTNNDSPRHRRAWLRFMLRRHEALFHKSRQWWNAGELDDHAALTREQPV